MREYSKIDKQVFKKGRSYLAEDAGCKFKAS